MTIPEWDRNKLIPPIRPRTTGRDGIESFNRSPYVATLEELVERFAVTQERIVLIRGFLDYRTALHKAGIQRGFQWVNGSFVENVEEREDNPHTPDDIDVVTYFYMPDSKIEKIEPLFSPAETKEKFHVDAHGIELGLPLDQATASYITYWHGMWSHRKRDRMWKGFVQVDLGPTEDPPARKALENETRTRR